MLLFVDLIVLRAKEFIRHVIFLFVFRLFQLLTCFQYCGVAQAVVYDVVEKYRRFIDIAVHIVVFFVLVYNHFLDDFRPVCWIDALKLSHSG